MSSPENGRMQEGAAALGELPGNLRVIVTFLWGKLGRRLAGQVQARAGLSRSSSCRCG